MLAILLIIIQIILIIIFIVFFVVFLKVFKQSETGGGQENEEIKNNLNIGLNSLNNSISNQVSNKSVETLNVLKNTTDTLDKKISNQNIEQTNTFRNLINELEAKMARQNEINSRYMTEVVMKVTQLENVKDQLMNLNTNIDSLEKVLNDKKARGTFGEIRLKQILEAVFGNNHSKIYEEQFMLSNGKRVDFILHGPPPLGDMAIDSKFPLENYLNITNAENDIDLKTAQRNFKRDLKKHIDDISIKYKIEGETSNQAIMFIPSESIFSYINADMEDIVQYSYQKRVWITSPTTFMIMLNLILVVLKDIKRNESYLDMFNEINKLKVEFDRYLTRWNNLGKSIERVYKDTNDLNITANKIVKKFQDIEEANVGEESKEQEKYEEEYEQEDYE